MDKKTVCIPVTARMTKNLSTGEYEIVPEKSTYANVPADTIARFLIQKFGRTPIFRNSEEERL